MLHDELLQLAHLVLVIDSLNLDTICLLSLLVKVVVHIKYVCDTAAHSGCEVLACCSNNYYFTTCHVLASVIADTLNNCRCTGVTNSKTLTGNTVDECLTASCTVKCNISDDDILMLHEADTIRWVNDDLTTGKSFYRCNRCCRQPALSVSPLE